VARNELARCRRFGLTLAVLLLDLDYFKAINDTYGHATGDAALRAFVATATAQLRARDTLGRYGGEEFLVVLPATPCEDARATAERLRAAVAGTTLEAGGHRLRVTTSIGVAEAAGNDGIDAVLARADTALYQAKAQGRNRTAAASPNLTPTR